MALIEYLIVLSAFCVFYLSQRWYVHPAAIAEMKPALSSFQTGAVILLEAHLTLLVLFLPNLLCFLAGLVMGILYPKVT